MTKGTYNFEVEDGDGNKDSVGKSKRYVVECGLLHMGAVLLVFCVVTTAVALLVFYLPDRSDITVTRSPVIASKRPTTPSGPTMSHSSVRPQPTQLSTSVPTADGTTEMSSTKDPQDPLVTGRLPKAVLPRRYLLNIRPYLYDDDAPYSKLNRSSTFDGWVRIKVKCMEPTDEIILHSNGLSFHGSPNVTGLDTDDHRDILDGSTLVDEHLFLVLKLKESLQAGRNYEIHIAFSGPLNDQIFGFYISRYYNSKGEPRLTAVTQMEAPDARRVLPCFDEPSFKASFDVQIEHRWDMTALSNGMETGTVELDDHWSRTYFKRVAAMPTYLLAMVVHDFENITAMTDDGCLIRVWMPPDDISKVSTALDDAMKIQMYFNSFLDIRYPLDKQDHVGVKKMSGAMENWGLIIYDEGELSVDDDLTITHEVSHQWFGNLVTMEWWDDLWLNEGFATYVEHIGIDLLDPTQRAYENFYGRTMSGTLYTESRSLYASPLKSPVSSNVNEIQNQFFLFLYHKGASILFMVKHFLADGVFEDGVRNYLKERAYKNVNSDDLWDALTYADRDVGKHDMKKIMDTWTLQPGTPLVTANRTGNAIVVKQQRLYTGFPHVLEPPSERYYIPFSFVHQTDPNNATKLILDPADNETVISLEGASEDDWYLVNYLQTGYYYVNYDEQNWRRLIEQAKRDPTVFTYQNQVGLIDQSRAFSFANIIPYEIATSLYEYLKNTTEGTREAVLRLELHDLDMLRGHPSRQAFERCIFDDINDLYQKSGWSEKNVIDPVRPRRFGTNNRLDITSVACFYGISDCVGRATTLFKGIMENPQTNSVETVFRSLVYCNGIRYGGHTEWDFGWRQMRDADDEWERIRWGIALTCSTNSSALTRFIETLAGQFSHLDELKIIQALAANPLGQDLAWSYVKRNWDQLCARTRDLFDTQAVFDLLEAVTSSFNTMEKFQELLEFGNGRDFGSVRFAYDLALTQVSHNVDWMARHAEE